MLRGRAALVLLPLVICLGAEAAPNVAVCDDLERVAQGTFQARHVGRTAELTSEGLVAWSGDDAVALRLSSWGRDEERPVGRAEPVPEADRGCVTRVVLDHGELTEWWARHEDGVQQGWVLWEPPPGQGPVELRVEVLAGDVLTVAPDQALLTGSAGGTWTYDRLVAWDAEGTELPAEFVDRGTAIGIRVDVAGARWPIVVDPVLATEDKVIASDGASGDYFGISAAGAGDIDGDGYDDLVVGAYADDDDGESSGSAYVYYGSATGIDTSSEVKLTASDAAAGDYFGFPTAGAGDVDGDGYADVMIGAHTDDDDGSGSGSLYVYYGTSTGLDSGSEDKLTASDADTYAYYGFSGGPAGDVDGDGYADIVVGAYGDDDNGANSGAAYVYYGTSTGIDSGSEDKLTASDATTNDLFGLSVAGAGDVDGDGYDDLVVGAYGDDDIASGSGAVYVYFGSATGLDSGSEDKLTASDGGYEHYFGFKVAGAGDVDGDGYADIAAGVPADADNGADSGSVYVFYGSASGIDSSSEHKLTASDGVAGDYFGTVLFAAGDLNGDGANDLVVSATGDDDNGSRSGSVYVYYGGCPDDDGDGICTSADCDDDDSSVGAPSTWYADTDSDGYGDPGTSTSDCSQPSGYVSDGQDCDDTDGDTWPGAAASDSTTDCMTDADGDGYGDDDPATEVTAGTDCDDGDASISPAAAEAPGDAVDQDCDDAELCYADNDDDGYTDGTTVASGDTDCDDAGEGTVAAGGGDCDDDDARTWPGAADLDSTTACMTDGDGDGYGDDSPVSGVAPGTDCDDGDAAVSPQATELVDDGLDQDCDTREACYADADGDGFTDGSAVISDDLDCVDAGEAGAGAEDGDCDDTDAQTWPGAAPSDSATACMTDADGDGYGDGEPASGVTAGTDCDDEDSAVSPSAVEVAGDLFDQDCDGTELCTADGDDDGYLGEGTTESTNIACDGEGEGTASDPDGDCDDTDGTVHPGAEEVAGDGVDQDCDGEDLPKRDVPEEDCGCTGAPDGPGSAWWVALVALVGLRRRAALRGR